jgi:Zn-dependent peptidase ImmA (M78 family)
MTVNIETASLLIKERTHQLVCELIKKKEHDNPPFLAEEYAPFLGVHRIEKVDLGAAGKAGGVLIRNRNGSKIIINKNDLVVRQNFTCAHELGHLLFSELKLEQYTNSVEQRFFNPQIEQNNRSKAVEKICDLAATELLMPESIFKKQLDLLDPSISAIEHLSDMFKVSILSAAIRTSELSKKTCITFKWEVMKSQTKSVALCWPKSRTKGNIFYSPNKKIVKPPSLFHDAFISNKPIYEKISFKVGDKNKQLPTEIKCFGQGDYKYILSLSFC